MPENKNTEQEKGWYERTVDKITAATKPYLHAKSQKFIESAIEQHAPDNPRLARMIEFEVKRRGDGAGLTQDVSEPLLWIGVKTAAALGVAVLTETLNKGKFKIIGYASALGIMLNNGVELFRLVPRYVAGLQGSLQMAMDRWKAIEETGVDPFIQGGSSGKREITKPIDVIHQLESHTSVTTPDWESYVTPKKIAEFAENEGRENSKNWKDIKHKTFSEHARHDEVALER